MGRKWHAVAALCVAFAAAVAADRGLSLVGAAVAPEEEMGLLRKLANLMWKSDANTYQHVWPPMEFGWKIVLGILIGFFGAAFGSVGGVGGGGIFVPMLTLIIGFDPKSSTAISKCMIMGASVSTVYYNLKLKHPTLDMPVIDYDLAVLIQPMLMLGISIGVIFNVIFPDWLVTVLLIILFLGLGGGFIMGPLFLELGIPPQVSSATATFAMMFSSSMSVVEYYLLNRFPVPYGGVGISNIVHKIARHEYMGFENLCMYDA
nr:unnamed protein product [Digitaria exilis]